MTLYVEVHQVMGMLSVQALDQVMSGKDGKFTATGVWGKDVITTLTEAERVVVEMRRRGREGFSLIVNANGMTFDINPDARRSRLIEMLYKGERNQVMIKNLMQDHWTRIYEKQSEELSAAYRNSPEFKEKEAAAANSLENQRKLIVEDLHKLEALDGTDKEALLAWIAAFAQHADNKGVQDLFYKEVIAAKLRSFGYEASWIPSDSDREHNLDNVCKYVVGQALECLHNGMPPHPMLTHFVAGYYDMRRHLEKKSEEVQQ